MANFYETTNELNIQYPIIKTAKRIKMNKGGSCKTVRSENERYKFYCIFASKYAAIQL
jgi:hypothetical protein